MNASCFALNAWWSIFSSPFTSASYEERSNTWRYCICATKAVEFRKSQHPPSESSYGNHWPERARVRGETIWWRQRIMNGFLQSPNQDSDLLPKACGLTPDVLTSPLVSRLLPSPPPWPEYYLMHGLARRALPHAHHLGSLPGVPKQAHSHGFCFDHRTRIGWCGSTDATDVTTLE